MWICVLSLLQGILLFWFLSSRFIRLHFFQIFFRLGMTGVIIVVIATMITRNKNKPFLKALYTSIIGLTALYKHLLKQ